MRAEITFPEGFERVHVLGIDPGTVTGFAYSTVHRPDKLHPKFNGTGATWRPYLAPYVRETGHWNSPMDMLSWLADWESWEGGAEPLLVGVEAFIAGSNQRHGQGQRSLKDPIMMLEALRTYLERLVRHGGREVFTVSRSASTVKRWATDQRLRKAWPMTMAGDHPEALVDSPHKRDALRHNLYAAVTCGYAIDPFLF